MATTARSSIPAEMAASLCFLVTRGRGFRGVELVIFAPASGRSDKWHCVSNIELTECDANAPIPDAGFIRISDGAAQNLADELWRAGVRPSEAVPAGDELSAVRNHLSDVRADKAAMQTIVLSLARVQASPRIIAESSKP